MANYYPLSLINGDQELLRPSDGGLYAETVDAENANSTVSLWPTVDSTGSLTLFAAFDGTANIGLVAGSSTFAFQDAVTTAGNLTVGGAAALNGNVTLGNAAGDDIAFTGQVASDITFDAGAARAITVDSQTLTLSTTTAGILTISSPTEVQVDSLLLDVNSTGAVTIDAATSSQFVVSGGAADLTLGARGATIALNDAANTGLSAYFTATTILGAINEVKTSSLASTSPQYTSSDSISIGDVVCLDWDVGNARVGVYRADNTGATRFRAVGVALNNAASGVACDIATAGEVVVNSAIGANNEGETVYLDTTGGLTLSKPSVSGTYRVPLGIASTAGGAGSAKVILHISDGQLL